MVTKAKRKAAWLVSYSETGKQHEAEVVGETDPLSKEEHGARGCNKRCNLICCSDTTLFSRLLCFRPVYPLRIIAEILK